METTTTFFGIVPLQYMYIILAVVVAVNLLAFLLMGIDKRKARKHRHRIPERVLLGFAICGGGLGILLGMIVFRHKTNNSRHPAFTKGVPIILLSELIVVLILLSLCIN